MIVKRVHAQARVRLAQIGQHIAHLVAIGAVAGVRVEVEDVYRFKFRALLADFPHQDVVFYFEQRVLFFERYNFGGNGLAVEVAQQLKLRLQREYVDGNSLLRGADVGYALGVKPGRDIKGGAEDGGRNDKREYIFLPGHVMVTITNYTEGLQPRKKPPPL